MKSGIDGKAHGMYRSTPEMLLGARFVAVCSNFDPV